ncbi:MAG TPA: putative zinc-binding metallopeptidase [Bacteroidota bacterium]|nr:putative zinc-binding metallopeptidase [Bacteroidota bacterium]
MNRALRYPRIRELAFQKLINQVVGELELRPADTLRECLIQLRRELKQKRIAFFPHFYFGEEPWGCIDRTGSIEIPFYLANNTLRRIAERYYVSYTKEEIMMMLRHETGHAVNYAYKLWKLDYWKALFGNFRKRYTNYYNYDYHSKDFVRYLHYIGNPHYAQKHPDEDFAETFAVWLDESTKWRWNYRDWNGALEKIRFIDRLFYKERNAERRPLKVRYDETKSYKNIRFTVAEYFEIEKEIDLRVKEYTQDLKDIFSTLKPRSPLLIRADRFIQNYSDYLEDELVKWIEKADRRDVGKYLRELKTICSINNLSLHPDEATEKLVALVIVSTYHVLIRLRLIK